MMSQVTSAGDSDWSTKILLRCDWSGPTVASFTTVTYALPIWGRSTNKNEFNSLESIHCRAARVVYNLARDMPSEDVRKTANWDSLFDI